MKGGDPLSPFLFKLRLEYPIKTIQENQVGLKCNGTYHVLCYTDGNLLGENIDAIKKITEAVLDPSKEIGLEITADKSKYTFISRQ